jgi:hypothetical protein
MKLDSIAQKVDNWNRKQAPNEYHEYREFDLSHDITVILNPCGFVVQLYTEMGMINSKLFDIGKLQAFF